MSKVTITIEVDRYICQELDDVRDMIRDLDFSGLKASVERIQKHANAMESAIRNYNSYFHEIKETLDKKITQKEKLEEITKVLKKKYMDW
jgi:hypothetical protein